MREWLYQCKRRIQKAIYSTHYKYANNRYAIAFRQRSGKPLYELNSSGQGFVLIPSMLRYWMADPFLFKEKETTYIFAEMYDKRNSKGVLGYAKLKGNHCGKFKVCLEEEFHLSYPCIFRRDGDIYMVPETKEENVVTIYKAVEFPKKWEKCQTICENPCVDTTPFFYKGGNYFFTTIANEHSTDDNLFLIHEPSGEITELLNNNLCLRSAGHVIFHQNQIIRPSQDDTVYGDAVIFNEIVNFEKGSYRERPFKRILPPGNVTNFETISVELINNKKEVKFDGLHTYNSSEDYEVIDLRYPRMLKRR